MGTGSQKVLPSEFDYLNHLPLTVVTGEADIDISEADYAAAPVALLTIAPAAGEPVQDVEVLLDLDKTTTGLADKHTTETVQFFVQRKVDGSGWRTESPDVHAAIAGDNADGLYVRISLGPVGPTEQARIAAQVSLEVDDVEFPFVVMYRGRTAPTVTAVAAA